MINKRDLRLDNVAGSPSIAPEVIRDVNGSMAGEVSYEFGQWFAYAYGGTGKKHVFETRERAVQFLRWGF